MAASADPRGRAELRKKRRRPFQYDAKIVTELRKPARSCKIADISQTGARLVLDSEDGLPDRFFLLLSQNGAARRNCRIIWQDGATAGVEFVIAQS